MDFEDELESTSKHIPASYFPDSWMTELYWKTPTNVKKELYDKGFCADRADDAFVSFSNNLFGGIEKTTDKKDCRKSPPKNHFLPRSLLLRSFEPLFNQSKLSF